MRIRIVTKGGVAAAAGRPLRPLRGHLPRFTGEETDQAAALVLGPT
jgi:hypothetical protein